MSSYRASEALELERNPFYWRRDRQGTPLPYLDHMKLAIVRDANTELLRIQNGQVDIGAREIRAEDYAALRRDELQGRVQLADAGVAADTNMLWFNLSSRAYANDSRKVWLQSVELRKAISHAVDRQAIVDQVFLGAAVPIFGPVTPGNRRWYTAGTPTYAHDPIRAAALLETLGLKDRDGDGVREDDNRRPVRFSILTQQQDTIRMRTLAVVQEHLRHVGIQIDIVGVDAGMIIQRWSAGAYDAIYFGAESTSYDPADNLDFWLSSGSFHIWNAEQETPSTEWEARIDELMRSSGCRRQHGTRTVVRGGAAHPRRAPAGHLLCGSPDGCCAVAASAECDAGAAETPRPLECRDTGSEQVRCCGSCCAVSSWPPFSSSAWPPRDSC